MHTHINNFVNAKLDIAQESLFSKRMFLGIDNFKKKKKTFFIKLKNNVQLKLTFN